MKGNRLDFSALNTPGTTVKKYRLDRPAAGGPSLDYDKDLNEQQRQVVTAGSGPLLVIAAAGSGKTHTLTYRMAHLVDRGVDPQRILLLTFTNRAARSMTSRASALVGVNIGRLYSGTFHSVANRFLRQHATRLDYPTDYTIIDREDASTLMKACISHADVDNLQQRFPSPRLLVNLFSLARNQHRPYDAVLEQRYPYFEHLRGPIGRILGLYQNRKMEMGLMDFDDLLVNWYRLLDEHDDLREELSGKFEHVLVDEYQDTNHLQGAIVDAMSSVHTNLMVVGDDCQSIYAFRGADYRNILQFPDRHPDCREFRLETNYRSTPQILELANRSIAHNEEQYEKTLRASRPDGPMPAHVHLKDANQQAAFVCQRILELVDEGLELDDIAVLYRSHHHSMELQVEMTRCDIPFVVRSGLRFFEQAHIKDALSYLRFLFNPKDELAFLRLVRQWHGIGNKRAQNIWMYLSNQTDTLEAIEDQRLRDDLPRRAGQSWTKASKLLARLRQQRLAESPETLLNTLLDSEFADRIRSKYENAENRLQDLEQLAHYAGQFESLDTLLGEISLLSGISGQEIGVGAAEDDQYVCLSSVHQAKGLEWPAVFILNLAHGEFPHRRAMEDDGGLEEERRLFYVATTRAGDELYLCHPITRSRRGRSGPVVQRESKFIEEIRDECEHDGLPQPFEDWKIE